MPSNLRALRYEHLVDDIHRLITPYLRTGSKSDLPHLSRSKHADSTSFYDARNAISSQKSGERIFSTTTIISHTPISV
jgi:hypothetical protein